MRLLALGASKESLTEGFFGKFAGILDNDFESNDENFYSPTITFMIAKEFHKQI